MRTLTSSGSIAPWLLKVPGSRQSNVAYQLCPPLGSMIIQSSAGGDLLSGELFDKFRCIRLRL